MLIVEYKQKLKAKKERLEEIYRASGDDELSPDAQTESDQVKKDIDVLKKKVAALEEAAVAEQEEDEEGEEYNGRSRSIDDMVARGRAPAAHTKKHQYSLCRALSLLAATDRKMDGLEREVSDELCHRRGDKPVRGHGLCIPHRVSELRDLTTSTGSGAIPTIVTPDFIEVLRNKIAVTTLGAQTFDSLTGNFQIPKATAASTYYFLGEGDSPTTSNQTISNVLFQPHTVGVTVNVSRRFVEQNIVGGEKFVTDDVAKQIARGVDWACVNGTGMNNQPTGILSNSTVSGNAVSLGTNGGAMTWAAALELEQKVASANAEFGNETYLVNAEGRFAMQSTTKIASSTFPVYIWSDNNQINGKPTFVSQVVPKNLTKASGSNLSAVIYGNFEMAMLGFWHGATDLIVDPYTASTSGALKITALTDFDFQLRYPEAFCAIYDLVTS